MKTSFPEQLITNTILNNILERQVIIIRKVMISFHEDLQFDYEEELREIFG